MNAYLNFYIGRQINDYLNFYIGGCVNADIVGSVMEINMFCLLEYYAFVTV